MACAVGLVFAHALLPACALDFDFAKIADTSTSIPNGTGNFTGFTSPALDGFNVAFQAIGSSQEGIYAFTTSLGRVADRTILVPNGTGGFLFFGPPSLDGGSVAFKASGSNAQSGVYTSVGGGLTRVADRNMSIPGGTGELFTYLSDPSYDLGTIAFGGQSGTTYEGVYNNIGGLNVVADRSASVPQGTGLFTDFGEPFPLPASHHGTHTAFRGVGAGQLGIYQTTPFLGTVRVADLNTPIPEGGGSNFTGFAGPSFDGFEVAFRGTGSGRDGIYLNSDGLNRVADLNTSIPGGTGNFTAFGDNVSLDGGSVALYATGTGQNGVFTNLGGDVNPVVTNVMFLDGKRISGFPQSIGKEALSNGNVAFVAAFVDGSQGIYVAQQSYGYVSNTSGSWDAATNWSFGLKPRAIVPTVIRPDNGVILTGPAAPTTIRSLELGALYSGTAELRLQSAGQLSVNEWLTVYGLGRLNVNGGVASAAYGFDNYGEIDLGNGGQITGGVLYNSGTLRGNGTIGSVVYNYNRIQSINAQQQFAGAVVNIVPLAQIDARNALLEFNGGLTNYGRVNFTFGTSDVFGDIDNEDTGRIIVSGNSNVTLFSNVIHNGEEIRVSAGSTAVFFGDVSGPGPFTGAGTAYMEGDYSPGASPASVSFGGNLNFGAGSSLQIELGGIIVGTQYDQVDVAGNLFLAGTLDVSLIDDFMPVAGNSFKILDWTSLSGTFDAVNLPALGGSLAWDTSQLYDNGTLAVVAPGLPGDFNHDNSVDAADYVVWRKGVGVATTPENYTLWQTNFGRTDSGGAGASKFSVPEPSAPALMLSLTLSVAASAARQRVRR